MFKIKASIIGALVFASMAMTLALDPAEDSVFAPQRSLNEDAPPSSMPSEEPTETPVPPSMLVGCLRTPGDVNSKFHKRRRPSRVVCDEVDGPCADFVARIEALPNNKDRLVKSIFACNAQNRANTQGISQTRFDRVKNDKDAIDTILNAAVQSGRIIMTGRGDALTAACRNKGYSCCPPEGCSSNSEPFTITSDSCTEIGSCTNVAPAAMIFNSCTGENSCRNFGQFRTRGPDGNAVIGSKIIGPHACTDTSSCQNLGRNILGSIRLTYLACRGLRSCMNLGRRSNQGRSVPLPVIADISIGHSACRGENACKNAHRGDSKNLGSLFIEDYACTGDNSCNGVANSDDAIHDLVIAPTSCFGNNKCQNCVNTNMCPGSPNSTYIIGDPSEDCPTPNSDACS